MTTREAVFETYTGDLPWLCDRTGYLTFAGDQAYGTGTAKSTIAVRGVACPPPTYILGYKNRFDYETWKATRLDIAIGSLHRFVQLCVKGSPAALELLFTAEVDVMHLGIIGKVLRGIRTSFLSKQTYC